MKKLLAVLLVAMVFVLSSCDSDKLDGVQCVADHSTCEPNEVYYTQEEVDSLLQDLRDELEYFTDGEFTEDMEGFETYLEGEYYNIDQLEEIFDFAEQDWTLQEFVNYIDDLEDEVDDLKEEFYEYKLLKFDWEDYNAVPTNHQNSYLTIHFFDDTKENFFVYRVDFDWGNNEIEASLHYNETLIYTDTDRFDGTMNEYIDAIILEMIDEVWTYYTFLDHYGTGE